MQKLLLEFNSLEDARTIKKHFEKELPYEIIPSLSPQETSQILANKSIHLIIQQAAEFRQENLERAHELRRLGYNYPILFIVDHLTPMSTRVFAEEPKLFHIEKPFELKTIQGLARKLMTSRSAERQIFRRFRTNQRAALETFISGEQFDTKMFNLSKGGAYFELPRKPNMGIGELLRMRIQVQTDQLEKEHNIHGRIVWTTPKGHATGGYGIGVKFIKSEDIYKHLLQNV